MKKLLFSIVFALFFLTGCEKITTVPAPSSLFVLTDGATADGIQAGDGSKEFKAAYQDYEILVSLSPSEIPSQVMPIQRIPFDREITTMIANFFINGTPMTPEDICQEEGIEADQLLGLLSSDEYLRKHEVLYRYLIFYWKDGVITHIASEELNYNETYETPKGL